MGDSPSAIMPTCIVGSSVVGHVSRSYRFDRAMAMLYRVCVDGLLDSMRERRYCIWWPSLLSQQFEAGTRDGGWTGVICNSDIWTVWVMIVRSTAIVFHQCLFVPGYW